MERNFIITLYDNPTSTGKYMWIVEEEITPAPNLCPDWKLVAKGFANTKDEAYKEAQAKAREMKGL